MSSLHPRIALFLVAVPSLLCGCMRKVPVGDPALQPYASMYRVPREQYGFTPLPNKGIVAIEGGSKSGGYDAMLHFGDNSTPLRTIAFRKAGTSFQWQGEQEIFVGPREYSTPDGTFHEQICITFYKQAEPGEPQGLTIGYNGPERTLAPYGLTKADVAPLMESWGYWH